MKIAVLVGFASLLFGCSSGELAKVRGKLKTCEEHRASLQQEANSYRQESERQKQSCGAIQEALKEAVPPPVEDARVEFLAKLPQTVRIEVQFQLDKYFATVARNFKQIQDRNNEILQELKQAQHGISKTSGQVDKVVTSTSKLEEGLDAVRKGNEDVQKLREQQRAQQQQAAAEIQKAIASIIDFDRSRFNCRECKEKLRIMDKNRNEILKFHSKLVEQLTLLQAPAAEEAQ